MNRLHIAAHKNNKKAIKAGRCPSCNNKLIKQEVVERKCWNCGNYWDEDYIILGTYDLDSN